MEKELIVLNEARHLTKNLTAQSAHVQILNRL